MSALKPWSQCDDDIDADGVSTASASPTTIPTRFDQLVGTIGQVSPLQSLVPLGIAAAWIGLVWIRLIKTPSMVSGIEAGLILLLIIVGAAMLSASWHVRSREFSELLSDLRANRPSARSGTAAADSLAIRPDPADLRAFLGEIEKHAGNVEDRTRELLEEHKRITLSQTLAESQRRQAEAIIESLSDPLIVTDSFDRLLFANTAAETLLGVPLHEKVRCPIAEVISDEKILRILSEARRADTRSARRRTDIECGDRVFAVCSAPLTTTVAASENSEHGVVVLFRDITQESQASKNKSQFVAQVAHELRTPLTSIAAYVEMLVDGEAADEKTRDQYYEIIQTSTGRLSRLIDNVLNISRIEARTVRINKSPVALAMLVKEAIDTLRPQAEARQLTLTEELTPLAYQISADRDLILQAIINLVSNAIKYTPAAGTIHVRMTPHEENQTIHVEVTDTGLGIPAADLPRVFEKFFRVEANKAIATGTGLGLNLVKQIVETIHEGQVVLQSEVGVGSTFGIVLPLLH